jgi:hypothetical protein
MRKGDSILPVLADVAGVMCDTYRQLYCDDDGKTVKKDCLREDRGIALYIFCYLTR